MSRVFCNLDSCSRSFSFRIASNETLSLSNRLLYRRMCCEMWNAKLRIYSRIEFTLILFKLIYIKTMSMCCSVTASQENWWCQRRHRMSIPTPSILLTRIRVVVWNGRGAAYIIELIGTVGSSLSLVNEKVLMQYQWDQVASRSVHHPDR